MKLQELFNHHSTSSGRMDFDLLFEMPQLVDSTEFKLDEPKFNKDFAKRLLKKIKKTYTEDDDSILFKTGDNIKGYYVVYNKDTAEIDYLVMYSARKNSTIGKTISQLALWRRDSSYLVQGLTKEVFYEILLKEYPAIMSDQQQTELGKKFWISRMAEAGKHGFKVGLYNENTKEMNWQEGGYKKFKEWLESLDAWGVENKYKNLRFVISN